MMGDGRRTREPLAPGDLLCTTPAFRALRRCYPSVHIAVLVTAHCRPLVQGKVDVDEVVSYTKAKEWSRPFRQSRDGRWRGTWRRTPQPQGQDGSTPRRERGEHDDSKCP
jgi:ADP-heptose:LPS heptosyltransferase